MWRPLWVTVMLAGWMDSGTVGHWVARRGVSVDCRRSCSVVILVNEV
jgi:hypothetical protein